MPLEEIPAGEQLMGVTSLPPVQANMQFLFKGLIWPVPEALETHLNEAAQSNSALLNETVEWVNRVLKPEFVAPDLRSRLRAATAIVNGEDAFLDRYRINQTIVQIVVTKFHVHLVLAPAGDSPVAAIHRYLRVDEPGQTHQWETAWETGRVEHLNFGYQALSTPRDWRESIYYLTNGKAVKFSLKKISTRPGIKGFVATTDKAERNWFSAQE